MKILVCISKTPDTTARISFKNGSSEFDDAGVQYILNPYDEWYALVKAIELKEKNSAAQIHLVSVGPADNDPIIRKAFALGGDEAIRINVDQPTDPFYVASQIAEVAKNGNYDLILTGKETIDYNGAAIGAMIAELLDLPFIALATSLQIDGNQAIATRETEGGEEENKAELPLVLSCQKGMAEARIPNMRGIMAARTKPLKVIEPVAADELTSVEQFELPPAKAGVKLVSADNVAELVRLLHEEARVI